MERTTGWDVWTCTPHSWSMSSQSQQDSSFHYISPMSYFIRSSFITLPLRVSKHLARLLETTLWRKCVESALFQRPSHILNSLDVLERPFQVQVPVGLPKAKVFKTCFPEIALANGSYMDRLKRFHANFFPVISFFTVCMFNKRALLLVCNAFTNGIDFNVSGFTFYCNV